MRLLTTKRVKSSLYITQGQKPPGHLFIQYPATRSHDICSVATERKKWKGQGLFVFISNKPYQGSREDIPDNVVVICAQQLKTFLRVFGTENVVL